MNKETECIGARGFSDIDRAARPEFYVNYLDNVNQMRQFLDYKRKTFDLMEIKGGDYILDVGCGTGADTRYLAKLVSPGGRVVGVDYSAVVLDEAKKTAAREGLEKIIKYKLRDAHNLEFEDNLFDASRADRTFQHLKRPEVALSEMVRVTKIGGRIVISEPDWETVLIYPGDKLTTRSILNYHCDQLQHGWIGRRLYALFVEFKLRDIRIIPHTLVYTNYELVSQFFDFQNIATGAVREKIVEPAQAEAWLQELKKASQDGTFFFSVSGYIAYGRKR